MSTDHTRRGAIAASPTFHGAPTAAARLFAGDGDVRARARALNWDATPLGPVDGWSQSFRALVAMALAAPVGMILLWGSDLVQVYNDQYATIMGAKHPAGLGQRNRECWPEAWDFTGPVYDDVLTRGRSLTFRDQRLVLERHGVPEETFFTLAYSPVTDDDGQVGGILVTVTETTGEVRARAAEAERARLALALETERADVLEAVFRQAPSFLAVLTGPDFVFRQVNDAYDQLVGGGRVILGKPLLEALPELEGQGFEALLTRVLVTGEPFVAREIPVRLARTPGSPAEDRVLALTYLPLVAADGARTGVIAHGSDVTEYVQARGELERLLTANDAARRAELEAANAQLSDQALELELSNQQLQEQAAELEAQADELQAIAAALEERTEEAERAARDAETARARAADILETMADAHFVLDREYRFVSANAAMERNVAHTREQLIGRSIWELFPATQGTVFEQSYRQAVEERREAHFVGEYHEGGLDLVPEVDAYPIPDGGVAVFWRDILPRRRMEAALAASESRFRTMADAIPTLAWTARADGYIDWYNARWYEYTGTTPEQMEGWGWQSAHDPATLPEVLAGWTAAIGAGAVFEMTFPLRGVDGRFRRFLTRVVPVRDERGTVVRWFGTNTDVEAERMARDEAVAAATRTARLQALTAALARASTGGDVATVVVEDMVAALGARTGALAGRTASGDALVLLRQVGIPAEVEAGVHEQPLGLRSPLTECFRTQAPVWIERRDGPAGLDTLYPPIAPVWDALGVASAAFLPLIVASEAVGVISFAFEGAREFSAPERAFLTAVAQQTALAVERARLFDAEREARAEAERANLAKSQFLTVMSHELRTPLNAIGGYAELLALGLRGPVTEAQQQDLERLRRANRHLIGLIADVLSFARIEGGQLEYHTEEFELGPVVADVEALVAPQLAAKSLAFTHDGCAPDTPASPHRLCADKEKTRQILLNVVTNAIKFTEAGGRVTLACDTDATAGMVRLRVTDTGRGIAPSELARIFEPFVQVDRHLTHDSQQGVGLGLAISRDLARGMRGDLTAESVLGSGSTFTLQLPLDGSDGAAATTSQD